MLNDITFDLPNGPANLQSLFPGVNFKAVAEYYLVLRDNQGNVLLTTPTNQVSNVWAAPAIVRLHFLNYKGRFDSITFHLFTTENDVSSNQWIKPLPLEPKKTDGGTERTNIRAVNQFTAKTYAYSEKHQQWLEQLMESPKAFMELNDVEGQAPTYVPVVVADKKTITRKEDERYIYELIVEFKKANEKTGVKI